MAFNAIRKQVRHNLIDWTGKMATSVIKDDFCAARTAYREQIEFGNTEDNALNLATIVYQQRHPCIPAGEARAIVGQALGVPR